MVKAQYTFAGYGMLLRLEEVVPSRTPLSFNTLFISAANPIASIIVVFIASLGVMRLTP